MIKLFLPFLLLVALQANAKAESSDGSYSKVATVHGMVCSFCSSSLEKKFKKEAAVEKINVNLEQKKVSVKFKKGKSLSDEKLKEMITSSGFKVVSVDSFKNNTKGAKVD